MSMTGVIGEFGLTAMQLRALMVISPDHPERMREVAERIGCGPSNLTGVIDKLEAKRLVERMLQKEDRRTKLLGLTKAGATLRTRILARISAPAPWMLALDPLDQRQLLAILQKGLAFEEARAPGPVLIHAPLPKHK